MRKILFLIFSIFIFQNAIAEELKLSEAYEQQLIERVRGVYSAGAMKEKLDHPICATPIFLEVRANWNRLSAETKKILLPYTTRPSFDSLTYDTPPGHFKIHYVKEGDNAVYQPDVDNNSNGYPDWVETVGNVMEYVWNTEDSILGYSAPPSDYWYPDTSDNGGDGKYDIYLVNLSSSELGITVGEYFISGYSLSATSYIELDNDYTNYGSRHTQIQWLEVTAAHEFFHAIQMGYDATEYEQENESVKPYWMEMSAVWMEDIVYDDINDYVGYLTSFFKEPWVSLKAFRSLGDQHPYGSCVWPIYLAERKYPSRPNGFDTTIIRNIWEECAKVSGSNSIDCPDCSGGKSATDIALEARGISFEDAFREFTVWNYFTASGDDGRARPQLYYSEGELFPKVKVDTTHVSYPVDMPYPNNLPYNLGSNYVVFSPHPDLKKGGIKIDFIGHSGEYKVSVLGYRPKPLAPFDTTIFLNPFNMTGTLNFYNWSVYNEVVMIPAVTTRSPNAPWTYEYQAVYDSTLEGESPLPQADKILQNYPNPFVIKDESDLTYFPFVLSAPSRVRIDIFASSGEKVRTLIPQNNPEYPIGEYLDQIYAVSWDGKNESGEYLSSGIYLYVFRTDRTSVVKKLVVIR